MRIAFTYIDPSYRVMGPFHVGIASLIAYLRRGGHECQFFHLRGEVGKGEYVDFLKKNRPDAVAFSIMTNAFPHVAPLAKLTKSYSEALTICGGIHATLSPEEVIALEGIDALCIGEGEEALFDLCQGLEEGKDVSNIPNLWVKKGGKVHRNPLRPLIEDLDSLPFLDREIFPYEESFDLGFMKRGVFMASRGCPYNCNYCCNHAVKQLYGGNRYIRFRSVDHLLEEVETVVRNFPQVEYNVFHDDLLPLSKQWFEDFTREYQRRIKLPFEMNCHPNLMEREVAQMAKSAGCSLIRFGLESGNELIRRKVLDRHVGTQRIIDAFAFCDKAGVKTLSYNMIGLPYETRPQIMDTIKLNARVKPKVFHVSIFYPYPGTKAYEICKREGFLTDKYFDSFYEDTVLVQKDASPEQLNAFRRHFDCLVRLYSRCYKMPGFTGKLFEKIVDLGILAATNQHILRALDRIPRQRVKKAGAGTCYTLGDGEVRVWGEE
ncbi:MAG: cobalamin B12-binding domain-containing protein [Dehalococcoidia bacterium]|nr:cobalamin B12-binding domain-containing protein [Dehalococcoidia bacterium]